MTQEQENLIGPINTQPEIKNKPETILELKEELLGKMKEVEIATSMSNYKAQEALDKALDIKSNKKLIAHFKSHLQYQLGITAALAEHSKSSLNIAIGMVDIVSSKDPRLFTETDSLWKRPQNQYKTLKV